MAPSVAGAAAADHQQLLGTLGISLKKRQKAAEWAEDGKALAVAIALARKDRKEAGAMVGLSESQLSAQIAGRERPQIERFEHHAELAGPMAVARALQHPAVFEVRWSITARVA